MNKYKHHKYEWTRRGDWVTHRWELVGPYGGLHLSAQLHAPKKMSEASQYDPACGLEIHYATAPEYMRNQAPSHTNCHLAGGRCWHDGTSLYARETLWPEVEHYLRSGAHDHVFSLLEREAQKRFQEFEP